MEQSSKVCLGFTREIRFVRWRRFADSKKELAEMFLVRLLNAILSMARHWDLVAALLAPSAKRLMFGLIYCLCKRLLERMFIFWLLLAAFSICFCCCVTLGPRRYAPRPQCLYVLFSKSALRPLLNSTSAPS